MPDGSELSRAQAAAISKARFLRAYERSWYVATACKECGVPRENVYFWLRQDPEFCAAFEATKKELVSELEGLALGRARAGSDRMIEFLLEKLAPDRYGPKAPYRALPAPTAGDPLAPADPVAAAAQAIAATQVNVTINNGTGSAKPAPTIAAAEQSILDRIAALAPHLEQRAEAA